MTSCNWPIKYNTSGNSCNTSGNFFMCFMYTSVAVAMEFVNHITVLLGVINAISNSTLVYIAYTAI